MIIAYFLGTIMGIWIGVTFSNNFTRNLCNRIEKKLKSKED